MITAQKLIETLEMNIVELRYEIRKNEITLKASDENGFDIQIYFDPRESLIYFGKSGHHDHFDHRLRSFEELIQMLVISLTGFARIVEYHWDGKARQFHFQEIDEEDGWQMTSMMAYPKWKFWKKNLTSVEERILQNRYLLK